MDKVKHACPECKSIQVVQQGYTGLYAVIDGIEMQLPRWECFDCGWSGPEDDFIEDSG